MSHDHAAHGHGGAHGAQGQGGYTHPGHGYGGAPKGYAVQHSAADENRRGREEGETLHYALYTVFARSGARPTEANTDEARACAPPTAGPTRSPTRPAPSSRRLPSSWPPRA